MVRRRWPEVLETLARLKRSTWALVAQNGHVAEVGSGVLRLAFSTAGLAQTFRTGPHVEPLQRALAETLGVQVRIEAVLSQAAESGPGAGGSSWAPGEAPGRSGAGRGGVDAPPADGPMPATTWEPADEPEWAPPEEPVDAGPEPYGSRASRGPASPGERGGSGPGTSGARPQPGTPTGNDGADRPSGGDRPSAAGGATSRPETSRDASGRGAGHPGAAQGSDGAAGQGSGGYGGRPGGYAGGASAHGPGRPAAGDDQPSMDDADAEDSGLVGAPLVARLLGGTVIDEQHDRGPGAP